jgi:hypothetical protein
VNVAICQRAQPQSSKIPIGTDITAFVPRAISTVCGLTGQMLEDAAAAAEDKKCAALSTELNEQFDRAQKSYAALEQSAFHIFNAQEMPISGPSPWQGVSDDVRTSANLRIVRCKPTAALCIGLIAPISL